MHYEYISSLQVQNPCAFIIAKKTSIVIENEQMKISKWLHIE